ncbi:MAG TPA: acyl-CoA ligase (AMP-forming), exosortase A system-associated [Denitromonas sp.]|nr:acyl-CoA ligase (AMP-forming), exosortase A system-associated [Denitromonas sp.]HQU88354.1 acyl-CoA ligase (AMP-forming), exosortase A system-associated [Denitromonas sp.]HQV13841.1 acyl-CoA ligase (AMP-forming), exosortase A system-associated [Denitromonas sp.]
MTMGRLLHELVFDSAQRSPDAEALKYRQESLTYADLTSEIQRTASAFRGLGVARGERIAVWMEKRVETVVALFAASAADAVFVPVNPLLKPEQVLHILRDCDVRLLVTTIERVGLLASVVAQCPALKDVMIVGDADVTLDDVAVARWSARPEGVLRDSQVIDADMAAILYTSGSTGKPKGVVLSHRNIVEGARSVAEYLENTSEDRILSVLPLSFDYGLNQITTSFLVGACAVLINYLMPRDVINAVRKERITGLAAVPPLWIQLSQLEWPEGLDDHLRYFTNSGGHMPRPTLGALRQRMPGARPYLMYGLTEAFRSTYLPPDEVDRRPDSMGKAIPNAEILVVRADGAVCDPDEPGELVHRGVHVSMGYWNDSVRTAERFKPAPGRPGGIPTPELAVFSGDTVRCDADGFLYFIGRQDEMIKTSGYRVSPTEVEEVLYGFDGIHEVAAVGAPHPMLGQAVVLIIMASSADEALEARLIQACRQHLPVFMVPAKVICSESPLPRNPNGKVDRKRLADSVADLFADAS